MDWRHCTLCPRNCGADRSLKGGICGETNQIRIARAALHFGEEPCIVGQGGSGTVFFSGCALKCCFCQNQAISRDGVGETVSVARLSEIFLELQSAGAENINLVTPSHFAPLVSEALSSVKKRLTIPVVCNCGGYESEEILRCFDGLVDIYLPDLKYVSPQRSLRYSGAEDYFAVASSALKEMFRQTGAYVLDAKGTLRKGMIVRHLVLPGGKKDGVALVRWLSETFPVDSILFSLMRQYTPAGDLSAVPELRRRVYSVEYEAVVEAAVAAGLSGYRQGRGSSTLAMTPAFDFTGVHSRLTHDKDKAVLKG